MVTTMFNHTQDYINYPTYRDSTANGEYDNNQEWYDQEWYVLNENRNENVIYFNGSITWTDWEYKYNLLFELVTDIIKNIINVNKDEAKELLIKSLEEKPEEKPKEWIDPKLFKI